MKYFVIGADETCLMCDEHLNMKIVGEFGRRKHEKRGGSCRASATMLRTGNAAGKNGSTVFVMAGKHVKEGYSDAFLVRQGAAPRSSIQMTENVFMTKDCWDKLTPKLIEGHRSMDIVAGNP